ncbi:hypothetical protein GCM10029992_26460 [Glycomyces albus]
MRTGIWLVGARGSVAVSAIVGALSARTAPTEAIGLVTELPELRGAGLPAVTDLVFGGHDRATASLTERSLSLAQAGVLPTAVVEKTAEALHETEADLRPAPSDPIQHDQVRQAVADLEDFRSRHDLRRVVVVNVASTEPAAEPLAAHRDLRELDAALRTGAPLPPSSMYAYAAFTAGCSYVDFTLDRGASARPGRARGPIGRAVRGPRRQDRRDAAQIGPRPDVRDAEPAGAVVVGPQPPGRRRRREPGRAGSQRRQDRQ